MKGRLWGFLTGQKKENKEISQVQPLPSSTGTTPSAVNPSTDDSWVIIESKTTVSENLSSSNGSVEPLQQEVEKQDQQSDFDQRKKQLEKFFSNKIANKVEVSVPVLPVQQAKKISKKIIKEVSKPNTQNENNLNQSKEDFKKHLSLVINRSRPGLLEKHSNQTRSYINDLNKEEPKKKEFVLNKELIDEQPLPSVKNRAQSFQTFFLNAAKVSKASKPDLKLELKLIGNVIEIKSKIGGALGKIFVEKNYPNSKGSEQKPLITDNNPGKKEQKSQKFTDKIKQKAQALEKKLHLSGKDNRKTDNSRSK